MNRHLLDSEAQAYINTHLQGDVHQIAMGKSHIAHVEARELAIQIAAKQKSAKKLPTWYQKTGIYYPSTLSIEQTSSEITAAYKSTLALGNSVIDLTGGFGVDSFFFARQVSEVTHCEINTELSEIAAHNANVLEQKNIKFVAFNGLEYLEQSESKFDTIYIDPARRSTQGKVFRLADCSPNVIAHMDLLLNKGSRIIIKTAPLLDLSAGVKELKNVSQIHIVSTRNEVKELLWVIEAKPNPTTEIIAVTLNEETKQFRFSLGDESISAKMAASPLPRYLYEPDTALLKSGAFNLIANRYQLQKLDLQTQLYVSEDLNIDFPGRIFEINSVMSSGDLKKQKDLIGNVISRNYRDKAENLVKKYKIKPDHKYFLVFTYSKDKGFIIISCKIVQHY